MTKEEKIDMFAMRANGCTLQQVADKYGITRERVRQILLAYATPRKEKVYAYPNISHWMEENGVTLSQLADNCKLSYNTVRGYLNGVRDPNFIFVQYILKETGMPFEVAFQIREAAGSNEWNSASKEAHRRV